MTGEYRDTDLEALLVRKHAVADRVDADPVLAARILVLRRWQGERLAATYADLSREPRYLPAVRFFLDDLYGPVPFTQRDDDLRRAWSILRRTLPAPAMQALGKAIELEVLTHELDERVAHALACAQVDAATYTAAYAAVGDAPARARQVDLVVGVGDDLDRIVRFPFIGFALRMAHRPAHAAGFGALQDFLERGFAAFERMGSAVGFLATIRERETALMRGLLAGDAAAVAAVAPPGAVAAPADGAKGAS
jgi:hypothetical protein